MLEELWPVGKSGDKPVVNNLIRRVPAEVYVGRNTSTVRIHGLLTTVGTNLCYMGHVPDEVYVGRDAGTWLVGKTREILLCFK
jgi:hypothetical protein